MKPAAEQSGAANKQPTTKVVKIQHFEEFEEALEKMEYRYWVFRGHGRTTWRIEPSLVRYLRAHTGNIKPRNYYPREDDSIKKFRRSAHHFLHHLPQDNDLLSWLAVMQHFGAPTRLVDFTFSPYAALFFAVEGAAPQIRFCEALSDSDIDDRYQAFEVHAVHLKSIRTRTEKILNRLGLPTSADYHIGHGTRQKHEFIGFFEGSWKNQRQVAQQGLFLVPSKMDLDIEAYLADCPSTSKDFAGCSWIRFQFPGGRKLYSEMINRLFRANVTAEALFPGLEGAARSVSMGFYAPRIELS